MIFLDKVENRINDLKKCKEYERINTLINTATKYQGLEEIFDRYKTIFEKTIHKDRLYQLVIGHGDLFFANMLYSKEINMIKFIDPKGALNEKDLWMHPYYDIAKLSHSICGRYDLFNVDNYSIELSKTMELNLTINFNNQEYVDIFKKYLKENQFDYNLVRIYEISLFLSMLPLHIDNPRKVLGFILNAINILEEVEKNV